MMDTSNNADKNVVMIMEVARAFWERTIELPRLIGLTFPLPSGTAFDSAVCFSIPVPKSITQSTILNKDYGFLIEIKVIPAAAQSYPCAFLESNKRPCWAMIQFNPEELRSDAFSIQNSIYVAVKHSIRQDS